MQIRHEKPVLTYSYKQEIAVPSVLFEGSAGRLNPPPPQSGACSQRFRASRQGVGLGAHGFKKLL